MVPTRAIAATLLFSATLLPYGCGDDAGSGGGGAGGDRPDNTGAACEAPADCYEGVDPSTIKGTVSCLDRVRGGYCTHTCTSDGDCCAAMGECKTGIKEVCSPFESTNTDMCFLSCEDSDLVAAPGQSGPVDEQEYCQREAGRDFICRSSGGGSSNRKICVPGDCGVGAACKATTDCADGLTCELALQDGYCTVKDCTANAGCPEGTLCVTSETGTNYCMKSCQGPTDCTFCRGYNDDVACSAEVTFAEAGTTGSVCVP